MMAAVRPKTSSDVDGLRGEAAADGGGLERHGRQVRFGQRQRVAELRQDFVEVAALVDAFGDVGSEVERDLVPQGQAGRHEVDDGLDVTLAGHGRSFCASSWAIALANAFHSCVRRASSSRPASVSR